MKATNRFFEQVDDYILGHLTEQDVLAFQEELKQNSALAEALDSQERILRGMTEGGRMELKAELKAIHQKVVQAPKPEAKVRKINWRPFVAAASLLLLGLVAWWAWAPQANTPQQIFATHYEPYELMLAMRDEGEDKRIGEAAKLYRQRQFAEAIPILEALIEKEGEHSQKLLALAISRFENGESEKAFLPLQQIIKDKDPFLSDQAQWYSALFYLKLDQSQKAIPFLEVLAKSPNAAKRSEAQKMLAQLKTQE